MIDDSLNSNDLPSDQVTPATTHRTDGSSTIDTFRISDALPDTVVSSPWRFFTRSAWPGAGIAGMIFFLCFPASQKLQFDRSITSMFDPSDPTLSSYVDLQREFGGNAVAMLVYHDENLWTNQGIARNAKLTQRAAAIQGVSGVLSPAVLNGAVQQLRPGSLLSGDQPLLNTKDPVSRGFDRMFSGYTHSEDHTQGSIVVMLDPSGVQEGIDGLNALVDAIVANESESYEHIVLIGEPVLVDQAFDLIERDGAWLATLTVTLLSIVVFLSLMDLRLVLLSIFTVGWSVTATRACLWTLGISLSLVSTILTAVTTVIAVTSVLHLGVRYRIARARGRTLRAAMTTSLTLLSAPILLTCLTDAAGFTALGVSRLLPVQQFGVMIAMTACCVFVAILLMGPLLMQLPSPRLASSILEAIRIRILHRFGRRIRKFGRKLATVSIQHANAILAIVLLVLVTSPYMMRHLETETTFLNNFESKSDLVQAYRRVETDLGGAGVWDIVLDAPPKLNNRYLKKVRKLEQELRQINNDGVRLTKVIGLADGDAVLTRVPILRRLTQLRLEGMRATMPVFYNALLTSPPQSPSAGRKLRLMLRSKEEIESDAKIRLIQTVEETVRNSEIGENAKVTGYYVLMARLIDQLVDDGWRCCVASGFLVWLVLLVSGRSLKRATIALLVNLLPAFLVIASIGLVGGKINMGSAMIAAVSIGLSIDGSVHFLTAYRRKRNRGHTVDRAAEYAAANIGVPMVLATAALIVGFGGLVTSEFLPTSTFGGLVAATLMIGTFVNLTILPALIAKADRSWTSSAEG